ncbi:enhanced level of genomic instability 1 [Topomyia yanbarensis]|uniref:enhanced level of genomic instability 1 n=1 Tax=Topomyia yanbarensis TaxID=2498891 RepID=UPI00273C0CF6|nr:enhanced level of genomic instability 1 [Topomyia yanbarensis]
MNAGIVKYFKSPKSDEPKDVAVVEGGVRPADKAEVLVKECSSAGSLDPEPGPSQLSKSEVDRMIAENMASVLKSLKKKRNHKCSRRRKNGEHREKDGQRGLEAEDDVMEVGKKAHRRQSPRKASKETEISVNNKDGEDAASSKQVSDEKGNKKVNAFQLMMSSRNKAIGSNSPGKNASESEELNSEEQQKRGEKTKRKLKLEEWAEKKGAGKRKLQEAAEEEFISHQLDRRAKRMKRLIKNMEFEDAGDTVVAKESPRRKVKPGKREKRNNPEQAVELQLKGKRGRQRLCSDDSVQSGSSKVTEEAVETSPEKNDINDDFVDKLNSPLKKRDSLLGYFNKVENATSPGNAVEETSPAPNKRRRGRNRAVSILPEEETVEVAVIIEEQDETDTTPSTPASSGRPRRSCANKVKDYAIFSGTSPEKEMAAKRSSRKPAVTPLKIVNVNSSSSVRSLSIDQEPPGTPKSTKNVKLAPLFVKKPVEDPAKVRARQEFLMSGIPEKMRLEIEKQRIYEDSILNESPVFPLISHVQQLESPVKQELLSMRNSRIKILTESPGKATVRNEDGYEFCTLTNCDDSDVEEILAKLVDQGDPEKLYSYDLPDVANVKSIVREWKQTYRHFPVFKCYKQFRSIYEDHVEIGSPPKRVCPKTIEENSIELIEPEFSNCNGELLFTEKYKPVTSDNILVNCQPAISLKKFLSAWKDDRSSNRYDSEDDFEGSNSSVSSNSTSMCNHVVLVGPPGCGKTCNVYAVANDMNFNVLELNASSRRKGKIILQELQEATQSHQVRRKDESVDIFKKSLARKGSKSKRRQLSTDSDTGSSKKLSLILVEDADIVFEQDEGFIAAINQLIATSKRPIVLTTTDPNCQHLSRYISNNVIRYVAPGIANVAKLLSILALVEKVHIDQYDLARLYALNRKDLRKTLNELHFFIQSGGDRDQSQVYSLDDEPPIQLPESDSIPSVMMDDEASRQSTTSTHSDAAVSQKHRSLFRLYSRNQNDQQQLIRMPLDFDNLWCNMELVLRTVPATITNGVKRRKGKAAKAKNRGQEELDEMVFFYQNISSAALIQRDSKSVEDRLVDHLEEEVAHGLVEDSWERWFEGDLEQVVEEKRRSGVGAMRYDSLKQLEAEERQLISTHIGINTIRTRSTYCDYEPFLRTICRCERERSRVERRGSRFYHYFRNFQYTSGMLAGGNGSGSSMMTNFSVDYFDALSTRFEVEQIPVTNEAKVTVESSDESR